MKHTWGSHGLNLAKEWTELRAKRHAGSLKANSAWQSPGLIRVVRISTNNLMLYICMSFFLPKAVIFWNHIPSIIFSWIAELKAQSFLSMMAMWWVSEKSQSAWTLCPYPQAILNKWPWGLRDPWHPVEQQPVEVSVVGEQVTEGPGSGGDEGDRLFLKLQWRSRL